MTDGQRLALVRATHTAIYVVMSTSVVVALYAGISGATGVLLWPALGLVAVESAVFVGNGLRCPLAALAAKYGREGQAVSDTFFPERITRRASISGRKARTERTVVRKKTRTLVTGKTRRA